MPADYERYKGGNTSSDNAAHRHALSVLRQKLRHCIDSGEQVKISWRDHGSKALCCEIRVITKFVGKDRFVTDTGKELTVQDIEKLG